MYDVKINEVLNTLSRIGRDEILPLRKVFVALALLMFLVKQVRQPTNEVN